MLAVLTRIQDRGALETRRSVQHQHQKLRAGHQPLGVRAPQHVLERAEARFIITIK